LRPSANVAAAVKTADHETDVDLRSARHDKANDQDDDDR